MSQNAQEKWDRKYLRNPALRQRRAPIRWITELLPERTDSLALDLACGTGRNALALAQKGWRVEAVDFSPVALRILAEHAEEAGVGDRITTAVIDLEHFEPPERHYDLILIANYLDRALMRRSVSALKNDGLFIVETFMMHPENKRPDANPDYLLRPGELKEFFLEGFQLLHVEEFWSEGDERRRMRKQAVVARKAERQAPSAE